MTEFLPVKGPPGTDCVFGGFFASLSKKAETVRNPLRDLCLPLAPAILNYSARPDLLSAPRLLERLVELVRLPYIQRRYSALFACRQS